MGLKTGYLQFDGTDDRVSGNTSAFDFGANDFSFECWVRFDSTPTGDQKFFHFNKSSTLACWHVRSDDQKCVVNTHSSVYGWRTKTTSANVFTAANTWYHVAVTRTGETVKIYIDGSEKTVIGSFEATLDASSTDNWTIGSRMASNFLDGDIDDVRIWSDVRTDAEISDNKDSELVGNEAGLLAYWKMNEGSGQTVGDATTNNYDGNRGTDATEEDSDPTWVAASTITIDMWGQPASQPVLPPAQPVEGESFSLELEDYAEKPQLDKWFQPTSQPVLPLEQPALGENFLVEDLAVEDVTLDKWFQEVSRPVIPLPPPVEGESFSLELEDYAEKPQLDKWFQPASEPVLPLPPKNVGEFFFIEDFEAPEEVPLDRWFREASQPVLPPIPPTEGANLYLELEDYAEKPQLDKWFRETSQPVLPPIPPNVGELFFVEDFVPPEVPDMVTWYQPTSQPVLPPRPPTEGESFSLELEDYGPAPTPAVSGPIYPLLVPRDDLLEPIGDMIVAVGEPETSQRIIPVDESLEQTQAPAKPTKPLSEAKAPKPPPKPGARRVFGPPPRRRKK